MVWGNLLNTLNIIISPIENFSEPPEVKMFVKNWWNVRNFESLNWIYVFINFWRTFWLQVALKIFLWGLWYRSRYSKGCSRSGMSSVHQFLTLRSVEMELILINRVKDKILFFKADWDFRNFCDFISFWRTSWIQVALKFFLWVIWWRPRDSKG